LDTADEKRLITETGIEARIADIVEPVARELGYRLVRVKLSALNGQTLQIMAERDDSTMRVGDCEALSKAISPVLDIEDPIRGNYNLEVSSPGIDRPLVRRSDFERWAGYAAKLETRDLVNGRKRFKGVIVKVEADHVLVRRDDPQSGEQTEISLALDNIAEARLVLGDELIREALRRDKALRDANGVDDSE
jgi:ribosome maturation factor RimP